MILFSSDAFAAVADFTERVVQIVAIEADPISYGLRFWGMC